MFTRRIHWFKPAPYQLRLLETARGFPTSHSGDWRIMPISNHLIKEPAEVLFA
jgi:hypothetical protein